MSEDSKELSLPLDNQKLYAEIDSVVNSSVEEGDPERAFQLGNAFIAIEKQSGLALGRLAFSLKDRWNEFNISERFEDVALIHWDVSKVHLERLIRATEMLLSGDIPEQLQEQFDQKDVKDLIVISAAWQEGDIESEEDWERLSDADNDYAIRDIVRDIRDIPPRKHTLAIWMTRGGDIYCKVGSGENKHIGYLNLDLKDDPDVEKAINRIINNSRIGTV